MAASDKCFLMDKSALKDIVAAARLGPGDAVLEIGAGWGNLTELIAKESRVTAIENDRQLFEKLKKRLCRLENADIILANALRAEFPIYNKIVSNIPYSISRKLFERIICEGFELAVLLFQAEFAKKLLASPGSNDYRMLSVLAQTTCEIEHIMDIPAKAFRPQPRVKSSLIRLKQKWKPQKDYIIFLNALFGSKNKLLSNILDAPKDMAFMRPALMKPDQFRTLYTMV